LTTESALSAARERRGLAGVIVLGMSRSGTSAVAEMFHRAGFHIGGTEELMAADYSNPRGYFENLRVFAENERILAESGGSWIDPPSAEALLANGEQTSASLRELLEQMCLESPGNPIAVKDPRIGVLLPVWKPAFQDVLHPLLVVRHPVEIAMSLSRRDATPIPVVIAAWEVHMAGVLAALQGEPVTVVQYAQLLEQSELARQIVAEVSERLDPALRQAVDSSLAADSHDPELRRNRAVADEPGTRLTAFQEDLWHHLSELPCGTVILQTPERFLTSTRASREAVAGEHERIETISRMRIELQAAIGQRDANESTLKATQAELERLKSLIDAIARSLSWRVTRPLRSLAAQVRERRRGD
jgi:hypothetical protein